MPLVLLMASRYNCITYRLPCDDPAAQKVCAVGALPEFLSSTAFELRKMGHRNITTLKESEIPHIHAGVPRPFGNLGRPYRHVENLKLLNAAIGC